MTVTEVKGFGANRRERKRSTRGSAYVVDFVPKVKVRDSSFPTTACSRWSTVITEAAPHRQRFGDGKIFITSIDEVIRIRTGGDWRGCDF